MSRYFIPQIRNLFVSPVALGALIDEIPVGILVMDPARRVILLNRTLQAMTGLSPDAAAGIPCCHAMRSRTCVTGCPARQMGETDEAVCLESDLISRDRQMIPVRTTLAPLAGGDGRLAGFIETVEDMRSLGEMDTRYNSSCRFADIVGKSPQMEKIFRILPVIAQNESSVLITGETGTGKDLVAEAIHRTSDRSRGAFIKVNCGALPEPLLESEIFGHQKGAFTGAVENKPGRFRLAHNGTLFLTEIGDLPLSLQAKLLTFLDDKVVYPLGGTKGFQADVRIIAATHRNLEQMVREGRFRGDLLFRLNVVRLHLPPLRERGEDVRLLSEHFLKTVAAQLRKQPRGFSDRAMTILEQYPYPGNVREMRNIIEYAVNFCQDGRIHPVHLPAYLTAPASSMVETGVQSAEPGGIPAGSPEPVVPASIDTERNWDAVERQMIMAALIKAGGRRTRAAQILGWGRSTLWRKMKYHRIDG